MIKLKTIWNRTHEMLISKLMSASHAVRTYANHAVTPDIQSSDPNPATGLGNWFNLVPEALRKFVVAEHIDNYITRILRTGRWPEGLPT